MHQVLSYRSLLLATAVALAPLALNAQATSTVTCKDGTTSTATRRGACSGHGGVDRTPKVAKATTKATKAEAKADTKAAKTEAKNETKAAKADTKSEMKAETKTAKAATKASKAASSDLKETSRPANATAANTDPTNATAKCKDGTYSHAATHRGACSRHGGVAEWLKS